MIWGTYYGPLLRKLLPYEEIEQEVKREIARGPRLTIHCVAGMHNAQCIIHNPAAECICECHRKSEAEALAHLQKIRQEFKASVCWLCSKPHGGAK